MGTIGSNHVLLRGRTDQIYFSPRPPSHRRARLTIFVPREGRDFGFAEQCAFVFTSWISGMAYFVSFLSHLIRDEST